ncbi:hypothetical protein EC968_006687 [Mortierella alpina]|nr:hypothetical protein EC968_006687 [Mortierella alpina]
MKSSLFALTFALALLQGASAQESVDPSVVASLTDSVYPTFMPSASPIWEDPDVSEIPSASVAPPVPTFSGSPHPSVSGVPHYSGSVRPPRPTVSGAPNYSGSVRPPRPTVSGAPNYSGSVRPPRPTVSGAPNYSGSVRPPRPTVSGAPHYSGSVQPPSPTFADENPSASVLPPMPSWSDVMSPEPSLTRSRSRPHRTTFSEDLPSITAQPTDGTYPTGL